MEIISIVFRRTLAGTLNLRAHVHKIGGDSLDTGMTHIPSTLSAYRLVLIVSAKNKFQSPKTGGLNKLMLAFVQDWWTVRDSNPYSRRAKPM